MVDIGCIQYRHLLRQQFVCENLACIRDPPYTGNLRHYSVHTRYVLPVRTTTSNAYMPGADEPSLISRTRSGRRKKPRPKRSSRQRCGRALHDPTLASARWPGGLPVSRSFHFLRIFLGDILSERYSLQRLHYPLAAVIQIDEVGHLHGFGE